MGDVGDQCTVCFTGDLQLQQGMLVCDVCGSVFQGYAEETQEFEAGISNAKYFKKSEGMGGKLKAKAAAAEPPPPPPVAEAVRAYVQAIQGLLQRQARALVDTFGLDAALPGVLCELWLAYLAHTHLLEPATLLKLQGLAEPGAAVGDDEATETDGGDGGGKRAMATQMMHARRSKAIQMQIMPVLHLRHTLALLLLASWCQLEAVSPVDVLRWALDGQLPYLAFGVEEGQVLEQYGSILGRQLITPTGVPSPSALYVVAGHAAQKLGLVCPPLNPALWLQRYLAELQLPEELLPLALQLHGLYQPAALVPTADTAPHRNPWGRLLAVLVVAVKLCYGVDGTARGMKRLPPSPAWGDWAPRQLCRFSSLSAFPLSLDEACQLDDVSFRAYLQYLQQGLFADCAPPPELQSVHQLFQRMSLASAPLSSAGDDVTGERVGFHALAAVEHHGQSLDHHRVGQQVQQQQDQEGLQQQQQQQQQQQGRQQQQHQQPAPTTSYHFYGPSATKALFHPEYALLLTACAPLAWLAPEGLHELVCGLERSMIGAECEVSFQYNTVEQARLARVREEGAWQQQREAEMLEARQLPQQVQQEQQQDMEAN